MENIVEWGEGIFAPYMPLYNHAIKNQAVHYGMNPITLPPCIGHAKKRACQAIDHVTM